MHVLLDRVHCPLGGCPPEALRHTCFMGCIFAFLQSQVLGDRLSKFRVCIEHREFFYFEAEMCWFPTISQGLEPHAPYMMLS
jgi:hypothetical protein